MYFEVTGIVCGFVSVFLSLCLYACMHNIFNVSNNDINA